jgi:hypothetical protein
VPRHVFRLTRKTLVAKDPGGHQSIGWCDALHEELEIGPVVENKLAFGNEHAQCVRHKCKTVIFRNQAFRPDPRVTQPVKPGAHLLVSDDDDREIPARTPGSRCEMQVFNLVRNLFLQSERQRREQSGPLGRQVAGKRRRFSGRDEHNHLPIADILHGFLQGPHDRRRPPRTRVVDRNPARVVMFIGA